MDENERAVDHYKVLEVDKTATQDDIRKSYYKLSLKYHPDKNQNNPEAIKKFHEIQESYKVLKDEQQRYLYDNFGSKSKKEIEGEADEVDEEEEQGDITVEQILDAMKAMGIAGGIEHAQQIKINSEFQINDKVVRTGGLAKELKRAAEVGVTEMDLSKLVIRTIKPDCIEFMKNLISLDLNTNSLRQFPQNFSTLTNLTKLNFSDNKFENFPKEVFGLVHLKDLKFERNEIKEIGSDIMKLTELTSINAFSNKLTYVPSEICTGLPLIQHIDLTCNNLHEYPKGKVGVDLLTDEYTKNQVDEGALMQMFCPRLFSRQQNNKGVKKSKEKKNKKK